MNFAVESNVDETMLEVNVTSFIDVLFVLLLFFMVTTTFSDTNGIQIKLPSAKSGAAQEPQKDLMVTIDEKGQILSDGKAISLDALRTDLNTRHQSNPAAAMIIRADKDTPHGKVVSIMDIARTEGIEKIAIATSPDLAP